MTNEVLLRLTNIHVDYGGVRALDGVDLEIDEGEIVALMGPNGAGKSTVLKSIFGLAPLHRGQVFWNEKTVRLVSYEMVQRGIAFVPQGRRVFSSLTVEENLEIGGFVVLDKKELHKRINEVMEIFQALSHKRKT